MRLWNGASETIYQGLSEAAVAELQLALAWRDRTHGGRGRLGMVFASETLSVLMNSGLPVLVSSTGEPAMAIRAIGIIRDEHRSLAAVMHAWLHALAVARDEGTAIDPALMPAIVRYLKQFPDKLHHPKESKHLFRRLRERTASCNDELDELERQHELDHQMVASLERQVEALPMVRAEGRRRAIRELEDAVAYYAAFLWRHFELEESVILPAAELHLLPEDWRAIDEAFTEDRDPMFRGNSDKTYRRLFSRIVNLDSR
jgi:hemerythrin-like domain-containing protein